MKDSVTFIGELNERITIKSTVDVKSQTTGATKKQLKVLKQCWSKVEDESADEEVQGRVVYINKKSFIVRYDERLVGKSAADKEIEYDNEPYNIITVLKIGRRKYLQIKAVRRE